MINSIELKNWKTHKSTKLVFSKGTNILIGQMGAGKSSVMDAISFALFGKFPAVQQRRVNVGGIITSRPGQEREALVKLAFSVDDDTYMVERQLGLNGDSKAKLEKNGVYVQSQPQRVTEEVSKVLKVDYDLFSRAVYAEQNGLDYFLVLNAGNRKKQIDELLGLDRFAAAQDNATSVMNKIRDMVEEGEKLVSSFDIDKLRKQLEALEKERDAASKERLELGKKIENLKGEEKAKEERLKKLKEEHNKKVSLSREIADLKGRQSVIAKELKEMQGKEFGTAEDVAHEIKDLEKKLGSARLAENDAVKKERESQEKISKIKAEMGTLQEKVAEKKKLEKELSEADKKRLDAALSKSKSDVQLLEKELATSLSAVEENRKWIMELKKHVSKCPVCERDLSEDVIKRLVVSKEEFVKRADEAAKAVRAKIESESATVEKLTDKVNALKRREEKLKELGDPESALGELSKSLNTASPGLEAVKREREGASELVKKLSVEGERLASKVKEIEKREGYLRQEKEIKAAIEKSSAQLAEIKVDEDGVDAAQKEVTEVKSGMSRLGAELDSKERYVTDKEKQVGEKTTEIGNVEKIHSDITEKRDAIDNLAKFKNALEDAQVQMRAKLIGAINDVMQDIWPELYPYGDYTGIMLDATPDDYVLKVKTQRNGGESWESVESVASGGERSIGCLAMRVAFALVLVPNLKWLILDEPTHNIDSEGLGKFVKVFNEILPRIVDQVFIITHDEMLKQVSSAKIYALGRNKEENGATVVQEL